MEMGPDKTKVMTNNPNDADTTDCESVNSVVSINISRILLGSKNEKKKKKKKKKSKGLKNRLFYGKHVLAILKTCSTRLELRNYSRMFTYL